MALSVATYWLVGWLVVTIMGDYCNLARGLKIKKGTLGWKPHDTTCKIYETYKPHTWYMLYMLRLIAASHWERKKKRCQFVKQTYCRSRTINITLIDWTLPAFCFVNKWTQSEHDRLCETPTLLIGACGYMPCMPLEPAGTSDGRHSTVAWKVFKHNQDDLQSQVCM